MKTVKNILDILIALSGRVQIIYSQQNTTVVQTGCQPVQGKIECISRVQKTRGSWREAQFASITGLAYKIQKSLWKSSIIGLADFAQIP